MIKNSRELTSSIRQYVCLCSPEPLQLHLVGSLFGAHCNFSRWVNKELPNLHFFASQNVIQGPELLVFVVSQFLAITNQIKSFLYFRGFHVLHTVRQGQGFRARINKHVLPKNLEDQLQYLYLYQCISRSLDKSFELILRGLKTSSPKIVTHLVEPSPRPLLCVRNSSMLLSELALASGKAF